MKPTVAADEMFPEGVGPFMDLEEVFKKNIDGSNRYDCINFFSMLNNIEVEMTLFDQNYLNKEAGGPSNLLMDLAANEKAVHLDFFNDFEDLFDDDDLK